MCRAELHPFVASSARSGGKEVRFRAEGRRAPGTTGLCVVCGVPFA
jgi:hypothetical protein